MSNPLISPDSAWITGSIITACITAGPAYITAKRLAHKAESTAHAEHEHTVTRDTFLEMTGKILGHLEAQDSQLAEIREWQAEHTTEHAVSEILHPLPRIEKRTK